MRRKVPRLHWSLAAAFAALSVARPGRAQEFGTLSGRLEHSDLGTPIQGILVRTQAVGVVSGPEGNFAMVTDRDGRFQLKLAPGRYHVTFASLGFDSITDTVNIVAGSATELNRTLSPAPVILDEVAAPGYGPGRRFLKYDQPIIPAASPAPNRIAMLPATPWLSHRVRLVREDAYGDDDRVSP